MRRLVVLGAALVALVVGAGGIFVRGRLVASLPILDGERALPGLDAPVEVERDALGVPRIRAASHRDAMRALGFVHAQERYFAMDLLRRQPAGELAALFGADALPLDRESRIHRMWSRARKAVAALAPEDRAILEAYRDGVRAGLGALDAPPPEYLLLGQAPAPWELEDSILAVTAMYFVLNDFSGLRDARIEALDRNLPPELVAFLHPLGTEFDAPLAGAALPTPEIPGPEAFSANEPAGPIAEPAPISGSNNWAVAPHRTAAGAALFANDMHLGHAVPNRWFRAEIHVGDRRAVGVTLPGVPALVAGSNGSVAWGFTNSSGDWTDLVDVEPVPGDPGRYRTPDGPLPFETFEEAIEVAGGATEILEVRETIWGPVIHRSGRPQSIRWIAHDPEGLRGGYLNLLFADTVEEAFQGARRSGVPPQNFVAVDRAGSIGWTIAGAIPRRRGHDGRLPGSWASGERGWDGYLAPDEIPELRDPPDGLIWTANNRVVEGDALKRIGVSGHYAHGGRARQIRDRLRDLEAASEESMLDVQLDDRAIELTEWRELFLEAGGPPEAVALLRDSWTGRASVDSVGYRLARTARLALFERTYGELTAPASRAFPDFEPSVSTQWAGPLLKLARERPAHWRPAGARDWTEALSDALASAAKSMAADGPLREATWGRRNRVHVRHPMSPALPSFLQRFLDAPPRPIPGDTGLPRAEAVSHGASERLVVSPGREESGIFHMPGGQAGHPLAPYYLAGHDDWEEGRPTPLLAGPPVWTLRLRPDTGS